MQTFLPYPDFKQSAKVLDNKRLCKQRVETKQIYLALTNPTYGWKNHPAVKMWNPTNVHSLPALAAYGAITCQEWIGRGFKDSLLSWFMERLECDLSWELGKPSWLGDPIFHRSHQSNLVRKLPSHYRQYFPDVPDNLPYIWPIDR